VGLRLFLLSLRDGSRARFALGTLALVVAAGTHPSAALLAGGVVAAALLARALSLWPLETAPSARVLWRALGALTLVAFVVGTVWAVAVWEKWETRQGTGSPIHLLKTTGYLMSPTLGLGFLLGAWRVVRGSTGSDGGERVLLAAALLGGAAALIASFFLRVSAQYVFVLQPLVAGFAALPLAAGGPFGRRARSLYLVLLLAPFVVESALYLGPRRGDRPRWREAYRCVYERREPSDLVLGMEVPVGEFYWNDGGDDLRDWSALVNLDSFRARVPRDWARYGRRTWFVVNHEQLLDWGASDRRAMERILAEDCELVASFEVPWTPRDLDVLVYLRAAGVAPGPR
jgi:hypothetical protein